jgi:hypothetical protein
MLTGPGGGGGEEEEEEEESLYPDFRLFINVVSPANITRL